jgi:2-isopropylmalate synthase
MTDNQDLIYDWNVKGSRKLDLDRIVLLDDESLRDGLQSPSIRDPPLDMKLELVTLMEQLKIDGADIGFPGATKKMFDDVTAICELIRDENYNLKPNCAARTIDADIQPVIDISHNVGIPVEVAMFLGSSPIRMEVEKWDIARLLDMTEKAVNLCVKNDIPAFFVTEDTTRANPNDLKQIYLRAVELGAHAICLSDTVGHATPAGAYNLTKFMRETLDDAGYKNVRIDWHGHRDRGLSMGNALAAIEAGADRIHGTGIGIGERCGNVPMDTLLVNLKLMGYKGYKDRDLTALARYSELVSEMVEIPIPPNYPVMGSDAFRTATGVHAAAIMKAQQRGDWWADVVYSGVPAYMFGKQQIIDIGPLSGLSNVRYVLDQMGIETSEENCDKVLKFAKENAKVLTREEVSALFN